MSTVSREILIREPYLRLPVQNGAPMRFVRFLVDGAPVREFEIELASGAPDFWVFADARPFLGQRLEITGHADDLPPGVLDAVTQGGGSADTEDLYHERHRPQLHFSSRRGWNNDPNGLLHYKGEYHLFYQHNPYGRKWGNMHWGHALSRDLVHWEELGDALYPDHLGTMFSGSGVVDWHDTAGFRSGDLRSDDFRSGDLQAGDEAPLVLIYTAAGSTSPASQDQPFTQCLAYSNDRGRTWTKYAGNPVLGHVAGRNRDPKVFWHAPTERWVMALYLQEHDYALFTSTDLKAWTRTCDVRLPGSTECPDLFELPVDGDPRRSRWVFWAADGGYIVGRFDGAIFTPESDVLHAHVGGQTYAAQTWSDVPPEDGRRIQIGWFRIDSPGMPFSQCLTFPCQLALRTTASGIRLCTEPVPEIEALYQQEHVWSDLPLGPRVDPLELGDTPLAGDTPLGPAVKPLGDVDPLVPGNTPVEGLNPLAGLNAEVFDLRLEIDLGSAATLGCTIRGTPVVYETASQTLTCLGHAAPLAPVDGRISLRVLVDRTSLEVFGNDGLLSMPLGLPVPQEAPAPLAPPAPQDPPAPQAPPEMPSDAGPRDRPGSVPPVLALFATGGTAVAVSLVVHELASIWDTPTPSSTSPLQIQRPVRIASA